MVVVDEHILRGFVIGVASMFGHGFVPQLIHLVLDQALQLPLAPQAVAHLVIEGLVGSKGAGVEVLLVDLSPSGRQLLEMWQDRQACVDAMLGPVVLLARLHDVAGERLLHKDFFHLADGLLEPLLRFDRRFLLLQHFKSL